MHSLSDAEKCNAAIICCVNCYRGFVFTLLFTVMHTLSLSTSACYHVLCKLYLGFYRVLKVQSNITLYYVWHTATAFLSGTQYKLGAGWHLKRCNKMLQLWFWWLVAVSPAPVESTTMKFTKTKCKTCQAKRPGSRTTMCRPLPIIFHRLCLDTDWQITNPWNTWWSMTMSAWIGEADYKIIWSRTMHRKRSNQVLMMPMLMTLLITLANPTSLPPSISRVFTGRAWKPPFIWLTYGFEWHMARHWRHIQRTYCTYDISNFTSIQRCKEGQESISLGDLSWLVYHQSPSHIMVGISPLYHHPAPIIVVCCGLSSDVLPPRKSQRLTFIVSVQHICHIPTKLAETRELDKKGIVEELDGLTSALGANLARSGRIGTDWDVTICTTVTSWK